MLAVIVKIENASRLRSERSAKRSRVDLSVTVPSCPPSVSTTISSLHTQLNELSSQNKSTRNKIYKVSEGKVNLSFRSTKDNYINMIPQISKEIYANFDHKYRRRLTVNRRSDRNIPIDNNIICNSEPLDSALLSNNNNTSGDIIITAYSRCYVEDYMRFCVGEMILVLVPQKYIDTDRKPWIDLVTTLSSTPIQFT